MCWSYKSSSKLLRSKSLPDGYRCSPKFLIKIIKNQNVERSKFKKLFEKYFENLLTPTPEELTLVDLEFGDGSADAYIQLLEETKKILD